MPTTYNGIGTHYYGKRNREARLGTCQSCGGQGSLESYDTRLWFVVFFIPVIPLGRKRIIDYCPRCSRHFSAPQAQWEMAKQLSVSGALERYRAEPSPETAMEVHGQMMGFHLRDEAEQFRQEVLAQYPGHAVLHAGMALQMDEMGQFPEALPLYEKALELRPDLPEARVAVARARVMEGRLDEARALLAFLEEPGAGQLYSLGPLEALARAYQRKGCHEETLELCARILEELPRAGEIHAFRKFVAVSEKAAGRADSMLPQRSFSIRGLFDVRSGKYPGWQRWAFVASAVLLLVAVGMIVANEYRRRHRTVYVLNDWDREAQVAVDRMSPLSVASVTQLTLPEGRHRVKVTGPLTEEFDIDMKTGYFERWTRNPVWVINVGGASAVVDATIHYAARPRPAETRMLVGEAFAYFPHVDYPFETPPDSLEVSSKSTEISKRHLDRGTFPAVSLFQYALEKENADPTAAFRFAEARLSAHADDRPLLDAYTHSAESHGQLDRAKQFLEAALGWRPVDVRWHRAYQDLAHGEADHAALAARYDAELAKAPNDAALLYLRGRVSAVPGEASDFFRRASEADPSLAWARLALAYDAANRGDWQSAREQIDKAAELGLDDPSVGNLRHLAHMATDDFPALEGEYRKALEASPGGEGMGSLVQLLDVLVAQEKSDEARQVLSDWERGLPADLRSSPVPSVCRLTLASMLDDRSILDDRNAPGFTALPTMRIFALLASGKPEEAVDDPAFQEAQNDPRVTLAASIAFSLAGKEAEAAKWREAACRFFDGYDADLKRAAALLRGDQPPSPEQLDAVVTSVPLKALLAAALAVRFPEHREESAAVARRLNVTRMPPYHLIRRAVEGN